MPRVLNVNKVVVEIGLDNGTIIEVERSKIKWLVRKGEEVDVFGNDEKLIVMRKNLPHNNLTVARLITGVISMTLFIFIFVVFLNIISGTDKNQNVDGNQDGTNSNEIVEIPDLEIVNGNVEVQKDTYSTNFIGIVKNNTNKDYTYAQIVFNLYDKDGNSIGMAMDNISNIKAGGTWKFKAMAIEKFETWELKEVIGW